MTDEQARQRAAEALERYRETLKERWGPNFADHRGYKYIVDKVANGQPAHLAVDDTRFWQ